MPGCGTHDDGGLEGSQGSRMQPSRRPSPPLCRSAGSGPAVPVALQEQGQRFRLHGNALGLQFIQGPPACTGIQPCTHFAGPGHGTRSHQDDVFGAAPGTGGWKDSHDRRDPQVVQSHPTAHPPPQDQAPGHVDPQGPHHPALRPSSHRAGPESCSYKIHTRTRPAYGPKPPTVRFAVPRDTHHTAETGMGGIAIAMPPIPSVQPEHFRRCSMVREGGVEPPRPCGHWNLNPARLPIPPPAHWVCRGLLPLGAWRLPTPRTLARGAGWIHIRSSAGRPASEPSVPRPRINA